MHRKPRWPAIAAAYGVFGAALGGLTAFVYQSSAPAHQPWVVRGAVVFVVAVMLIHMRRWYRGDPLWEFPSEFEAALSPAERAVVLHPEFAKLRDEIARATARRSEFERTLGPRLRRLAQARGAPPEAVVPASMPRRGGLPARRLADLIGRLEDLP